jgi:uncharacterized membrane protein (DUF373 family)
MPGISYNKIHDLFRRLLENIQDIIVIGTCGLLFALMVKTLLSMYFALAQPFEFQYVASELIYILVLVEIYRLLIIYIREHRIAVDIMIEVGIVSILREIILHGILEINPLTILTVSVLFFSLLLLLRYGAIRKEEVEVLDRGTFIEEFRGSLENFAKRREKNINKIKD